MWWPMLMLCWAATNKWMCEKHWRKFLPVVSHYSTDLQVEVRRQRTSINTFDEALGYTQSVLVRNTEYKHTYCYSKTWHRASLRCRAGVDVLRLYLIPPTVLAVRVFVLVSMRRKWRYTVKISSKISVKMFVHPLSDERDPLCLSRTGWHRLLPR